jgi:DNA-directed RNA polymerase specialized sigma24 family protein
MSNELNHSPFAAVSDPTGPGAREGGVFASTHWSVVASAGAATTVESVAALDRLCRQYWQPLYYFVRRRGYNEHDAQDLTQGFFARLLEKGLLGAADRKRGRFRTFLLTALENYLANEWDKANRQKRGGGQQFLSLEHAGGAEAGYQLLPSDMASPDQLYERRWAHAVLEAVLRRLREEFDGGAGTSRFDVLKEFLFSDRGEISYADAAGRIGLSESATKSAIYRLRQRYGQLFADEIAQTVERPEDVDDEIRHLLAVLEAG